MSTTFLSLVNDVAGRLNETPLTSGNFATAAGFYTQIKEAVNSAITDINSDQFRWPFNYAGQATQVLTIGVQTYTYHSGARDVDLNTFELTRDDSLSPPAVNAWLPPIDYDEYAQRYRDIDLAMNSSNYTFPRGVVQTRFINKYLITPVPDQAYTVTYDYWSDPTALSLYSDTTSVPDNFTNVITDGAMYYAYMFRGALEQAMAAQKNFKDGLSAMRRVYIPFPNQIRDTRVGPQFRFFNG